MAKQVKIDNINILTSPKNWSKRDNLLLPALTQKESYRLDDRSVCDMVVFTKKLSKLIRYYNLSDKQVEDIGYWHGFLQNISPYIIPEHTELIDKLEKKQLLTEDITRLSSMLAPHEVLFLAFLLLMLYPREQINNFPERYLNYYYRNYLGFIQKPSTPSKVHVTFELNENASNVILDKGSLLSAGVDSQGKEIFYEVEENVLITGAQITNIQTLSGINENGKGLVLTSVLDKEKSDGSSPKIFKTFGEEEGISENIGFAISSPILATSSGNRILTMTLIFKQSNNEIMLNIEDIFTFYITGETDWINLEVRKDENVKKNEIKFSLNGTIMYPEAYDPGIFFSEKNPILKVILKDLTIYKNLKDIQLEDINLTLEVSNVTDLKMANNEVIINTGTKPIYPFGLQPVTGSSLYFIHPDLIGKTISALKLEMQWIDLPQDGFNKYYKDYFQNTDDNIIQNSSFTAALNLSNTLLDNRNLFQTSSTSTTSLLNSVVMDIPPCNLVKFSSYTALKSSNPLDWPEYFVLSLNRDFLHSIYPKILAEAVATKSTIPNSPYTPACSSVVVTSYVAKAMIRVNEESHFKHIGPWITKGETTILPTYPDLGYLFLGITGLEHSKPLTMLWQASNEVLSDNNQVRWEYWSNNNNWKKFTPDNKSIEIEDYEQIAKIMQSNTAALITKDTTSNLSGSGIITFQIPEDISNTYPSQTGKYLIRAVLNEKSLSNDKPKVLDTIDVKLHAVVAIFYQQNQTLDNSYLLEPNSIKGLVKDIPNIKKVLQPYSGFSSKPAETEEEFKVRVGARLKHKNRAIVPWDYERLILAEFPEVYMVKTSSTKPSEVMIEVVVSADQNHFLIWPKASEQLLNKIKTYIQKYTSAIVQLEVKNIDFTKINITTTVRFIEENLSTILERDIRWFLSPWGNSKAINLDKTSNTHLYHPEIVNFIKTRDYISQVESFQEIEHLKSN